MYVWMTRGKFAFENFSISLENVTTSVRFLISIPFGCSAMRNGTLFHSSYSLPRLRKLRTLLQWHIKLFNVPAMFIVRLCPSAMQVMLLLSISDTSIMDKVEKKACVWDWNLIPVKKRNKAKIKLITWIHGWIDQVSFECRKVNWFCINYSSRLA